MARRKQTGHPFRGVTDFFSEMNRMSEVMHGRGAETEARTETSAWAPLTDIKARGEDLMICCELPGVAMEDITISFANGVLSISGIRKTSEDSYYVRERFFGNFRRAVSLPEGVGDDDIHAALRSGLLVITVLGGATAAEPKQIPISEDTD